MANTKTYVVTKDGEMLKELKTLAAAKKLADTEGAEVYCDGECVYQAITESINNSIVENSPHPVSEATDEKAEEPVRETEIYTLLRKMNVRKTPSLTAEKVKVLDTGATVAVKAITDDWLCLTDGTFILYENGKNARKGKA